MTAAASLVRYRPTPPTSSGAGGIPVMWAASRFVGPIRAMIAPQGTSIGDIVARALLVDQDLPRDFTDTGIVTVNGIEVPQIFWPYVRPRRPTGQKVYVVLHPGLGKGGGALAMIIQIAAFVAAFAIAGPFGAAAALSLTAAQASILAIGITVAGSLAARALSPPPTSPFSDTPMANSGVTTNLGRAGVSGNAMAPNAPVPRLTGERRYAPPFGANPYVEIDGNDEVVECLWTLAEPTALNDLRLGNVFLEDMSDAEYQISEGKPGDEPLTLITRQTATDEVAIDMSRHKVDAVNGTELINQLRPDRCVPVWHPLVSRRSPDEIVMTITCSGGMLDLNAPTTPLAVPVRIRFKRRGDAGHTLAPEIHFNSSNGQPFHKYIKLVWETPPLFASQAPAADAPVLAYKSVPAQTLEPARPGWLASDYFSTGAGDDVMSSSTFGTHKVRNVSLNKDGVVLHLDPEVFPKGDYEIEVMFGLAYTPSSFSSAAYTYGGTVYDLFGYYLNAGKFSVARTRASLRDEFSLQRCASIWHENPLPQPEGIAFIAIKVRNRQLGELTVNGAGLVPLYNGTEWEGLGPTRNPAPHLRDRLTKLFPAEIIGDQSIIDWSDFNDDNGYETCVVLNDGSFMDGLNLLASAGRARPRQSDVWDVIVDRDTSAEAPVQTFSVRNSRGMSFNASLAQELGGFRVRFADRSADHRESHVIVRNPKAPDLSLPLEEIVNESQDTIDAVTARALFDLAQYEERPVDYQFEVPALGMRARRGDVIAVNHDILSPLAMGARIVELLMSGSNVTGLVLDGTLPTPADTAWSGIEAAWSNYSLAFAVARFGVAIRLKNRTEIRAEIVATGDESNIITFVTPFALPAGLTEGCHVVSGPLTAEYKRMKIQAANNKGNMEWALVCVDEANQIHSAG